MADSPNANPDGIRRYEELTRGIRELAEQALGIAIANSISGADVVLDVEHGGTGTSYKSFVDTYTNQFEIGGIKIFHESCGFQKESDIVDSGEMAGNVRVITCTPQGADIGPQIRFSGRNTDDDAQAFAFGTIAGRKYNSASGDRSGYLQFATTDINGAISEVARLDHEGTFGVGTTVPIKGEGNRVHASGGDILIDRIGGPRSVKLEIHSTIGRLQAVHGYDQQGSAGTGTADGSGAEPGDQNEHLFLSANVRFAPFNQCFVDELTKSTCAVQLKSFKDLSAEIRFLIGPVGDCPVVRGVFHETGLDVVGNALATGHIVAGGENNFANGTGNCDSLNPGVLGGDNIHFGEGDPEGVVCAPIGALYGREDAGTTSQVVYAKTSDSYGNTGWEPIRLGQTNSVCVDSGCPDPDDCQVWHDTVNNMTWQWDANAKGTGNGAWLSTQVFQAVQPVPLGETAGGGAVAQEFRGRVNKHYVYFTPTHVKKNRRHSSGKFDIFFDELVATLRVANNDVTDSVNPDAQGLYQREKHYYIFDLVTLRKQQGDPRANSATKQEWPGDRDADEVPSDNIKALGHSFHPDLPSDLVRRALPNISGIAIWTGTVDSLEANHKRTHFSPAGIVCYDADNAIAGCGVTPVAANQWKQNLNRETASGLPLNDGYVLKFTTGANAGDERFILDNGLDVITTRKTWDNQPQIGDAFEVYSATYRRVIARVTTRGNVYPHGPYGTPTLYLDGNTKTRDVQDFVETGSYATTYQSNLPGGINPGGFTIADQQVDIGYYMPLVTDVDPGVDAVIIAGLWDSVRTPGKISGAVSLSYRLALPTSSGNCV